MDGPCRNPLHLKENLNAVLIAFGSLLLTVEGLEKHMREVKFNYSRVSLIVHFFIMVNGLAVHYARLAFFD